MERTITVSTNRNDSAKENGWDFNFVSFYNSVDGISYITCTASKPTEAGNSDVITVSKYFKPSVSTSMSYTGAFNYTIINAIIEEIDVVEVEIRENLDSNS